MDMETRWQKCLCYSCGKPRRMQMSPVPGTRGTFRGKCPTCGRERRWGRYRETAPVFEHEARAEYEREQRALNDRHQREYATLVAEGNAPPISHTAKIYCAYCRHKSRVKFLGPRSDQPLEAQCPTCDAPLEWDLGLNIQRYPSVTNAKFFPLPEPTARDKFVEGGKKVLGLGAFLVWMVVVGTGVLLAAGVVIGLLLSGAGRGGGGIEDGCTEYGGPAAGQC